jgi:hypothetical protein
MPNQMKGWTWEARSLANSLKQGIFKMLSRDLKRRKSWVQIICKHSDIRNISRHNSEDDSGYLIDPELYCDTVRCHFIFTLPCILVMQTKTRCSAKILYITLLLKCLCLYDEGTKSFHSSTHPSLKFAMSSGLYYWLKLIKCKVRVTFNIMRLQPSFNNFRFSRRWVWRW